MKVKYGYLEQERHRMHYKMGDFLIPEPIDSEETYQNYVESLGLEFLVPNNLKIEKLLETLAKGEMYVDFTIDGESVFAMAPVSSVFPSTLLELEVYRLYMCN